MRLSPRRLAPWLGSSARHESSAGPTRTPDGPRKLASNASFSEIFVLFVLFVCFVCFVVHLWPRPLVCHGNMPLVAILTIGL